jgi:hypothetical protein
MAPALGCGAARYIVKHVREERKKEVAAKTYGGRVMSYSKGFLSQSMNALWRDQLREWNVRRGRALEHYSMSELLVRDSRAEARSGRSFAVWRVRSGQVLPGFGDNCSEPGQLFSPRAQGGSCWAGQPRS